MPFGVLSMVHVMHYIFTLYLEESGLLPEKKQKFRAPLYLYMPRGRGGHSMVMANSDWYQFYQP
ncbi:hypothetical protein CPM_1221 [Cuniculiplasma divulgatum]|uniref:Uncharacterized protein n=1 Tax=Cuniculiplasma divulgatum TaxID=1673428 RepID=A0A1R4A7U0_9ARCH|nr:hypothetical protein CPM_1221 [Cuniculiplasma divulgatum]